MSLLKKLKWLLFVIQKIERCSTIVSYCTIGWFRQFFLIIIVGPEIWGPSPLCVKGPKPCPIKPNRRGRTMKLPEGPRTWPRTISRPTSHKNAWRKGQIQYKSSTNEKAANTIMWSPAPDKPILIPCYPAFPNHSDVWIDKTSNYPNEEKRIRRWRTVRKY